MKIPKCIKSVSGKHEWNRKMSYLPGLGKISGKWVTATYPTTNE